jgi:(S)-ureidoglycine aminohydrolase
MKSTLLIAAILTAASVTAQTTTSSSQPIKSDVYSWQNLQPEKKESSVRRQIIDGVSPVVDNLEVHATTIEPGGSAHAPHSHPEEELLIIKEGTVKVTINDKTQILGPGSIAYSRPGDQHGVTNVGKTAATYYVLKYKAKKDSAQTDRAVKAGGSFMINWNDITFTPHDKGGIRKFTERPTAIFRRFEMHVTTLNAGLKSHDPHRHKAEEIVLLIEGSGNMQIGEEHKPVVKGDLIYLGSNDLHAISNNSDKPCTYFAFQWD